MAKLPNRLVIEIADTNKVDELGNPIISFESKDYAECVIEELEKIRAEIEKEIEIKKKQDYSMDFFTGVCDCLMLIENRIDELKEEGRK